MQVSKSCRTQKIVQAIHILFISVKSTVLNMNWNVWDTVSSKLQNCRYPGWIFPLFTSCLPARWEVGYLYDLTLVPLFLFRLSDVFEVLLSAIPSWLPVLTLNKQAEIALGHWDTHVFLDDVFGQQIDAAQQRLKPGLCYVWEKRRER